GDLLLQTGDPHAALKEYEAALAANPNRYRGFWGAAQAAEKAGDRQKAMTYYAQLVDLAQKADTERPEIKVAKAFRAAKSRAARAVRNGGRQCMMIRSIAIAALLGAAVAAGLLLASPQPAPQAPPATASGVTAPVAAAAAEAWPICSTMESVGADADWAELDLDFAAGKRALAAADWNAAIASLKLAALRDPRNADIENHIGYAFRRLRQLDPAFAHYRRALALDPRHRSAHEHMGEAYLVTGDPGKAEEHLAMLENLCLIPCVEFRDLQQAIAAYRKSAMR